MIPHLKLTYKSAAAILDISWCFENCHWLAIVLWYVLRLLVIGPICNTKKLPLILRKPLFKTNTFKPPVSGHPRFSGLIRVVAYENQLRDGLFRGVVQTPLLFEREFFACNFLVTICELSCCHGSGVVHTANKKIPTCVKCMVVYKLLRKMENYKTVSPKCDRRRLR